ncbi:MAG TPA: TIGR02757 family protein [Nitrospiria bacterium]|nr:TIGR02757 family protein [Nitrospiria bacterium]
MRSDLAERLERWYRTRDLTTRVAHDPVAFPRRYHDPDDQAAAGLIAASLAYGHVNAFRPTVERLLAVAGDSPAAYLRSFDLQRERPRFIPLYYRFSDSSDLLAFFLILRTLINRHGSLRVLFESLARSDEPDIGPLLGRYVNEALAVDTQPVYGHRRKPPGLRHLFSGPAQGGASKRLCMYLRWMVRPEDGVDLGLWPALGAPRLIVPLDAHVARLSRYLGLTSRQSAGWLMAREVTASLRTICPEDPVKYDFALCHYGMSGECPVTPLTARCLRCDLQPVCRIGRRRGRSAVTPRPHEAWRAPKYPPA